MNCAVCAVPEVKLRNAPEPLYRCPTCGSVDDAAGMPLDEHMLNLLADVHCHEDNPATCAACAARALLRGDGAA